LLQLFIIVTHINYCTRQTRHIWKWCATAGQGIRRNAVQNPTAAAWNSWLHFTSAVHPPPAQTWTPMNLPSHTAAWAGGVGQQHWWRK